MNPFLRFVPPIAGFGFLVSLASQVAFWVGIDLLGGAWGVMFAGIFVVWLPTVHAMQRLQLSPNDPNGWRTIFVGAPSWVPTAFYAVFAFAIINFFLGFVGMFGAPEDGSGFWRIGSSHAMVFYGAAWGIATAAIRRAELGIEWQCERGHSLSPSQKFCPECGAPARPLQVTP